MALLVEAAALLIEILLVALVLVVRFLVVAVWAVALVVESVLVWASVQLVLLGQQEVLYMLAVPDDVGIVLACQFVVE